MSFARARNTVKAYRQAWKNFSAWCAATGFCSLPATAETVADFIAWCIANRGNRLGTVRQNLAAIGWYHAENSFPSPIDTSAHELLRNAARMLKERPQGKSAVTPQQLTALGGVIERNPSPIARRDHAMILLGFAAGWRSSEILSLALADIRFDQEGRLCVYLGASKTDQTGSRGREVCLPRGRHAVTCPVRALQDWLAVRGDWPGALFCAFNGGYLVQRGIRNLAFNIRLKKLLAQIGENPARYGTHSLRVGMITSAVENGADALLIMQRTGQKSMNTVLRYVRPAEAVRADPLAGVL